MKRAMLFCAAAMMVFAGCGGEKSPTPARQEAAPKKKDRLEIAVIPKAISHQFWVTVHAGAEAAGKDLGVDILWQGPARETEIDKQISIMQDMIVRGVDGIVMAACDENALVNVVDQADKKGIPVVTFDSGLNSDIPKSLVASDNVAAAKEGARVLAELIGGAGEVGCIPNVPGAASSEMRERGFKEGIAAYPNIKLVATNYSHSDVSMGMNVATDMITAFPNIKGFFTASEPAALGAAQAMRTANKAGEVKIVAFDASGEQLNALKEGAMHALIVQNPFKIGYDAVKTAVAVLKGQPVEKRIDTGVTVVTKENMNTPEVQKLLNPTG